MLKVDGKWILYGLLGGAKAKEINMANFISKRISIISTNLRYLHDFFVM